MKSESENTYRERLPWHGFGTDNLQYGLRMYPTAELLKRANVQHNPKHSIGFLVYDVDRQGALLEIQDRQIPEPNFVVVNRENGHSHWFYGLETPVHNYLQASDKALRYAAAVDIGMMDLLDADRGYAGLISKNPTHDKWFTWYLRDDFYELAELAEYLDLKKYTDRRRKLPDAGLGRNCTVFTSLRRWAYAERRKEQQYFSHEMFIEACRWRALHINSQFPTPLPHSEIRAISKSVGNWVWKPKPMSNGFVPDFTQKGFKAWCSRKGKASGVARRRKAIELAQAIIETRNQCPELTQADIAEMHGIARETVNRILRSVT